MFLFKYQLVKLLKLTYFYGTDALSFFLIALNYTK